jgi:hypothetical protein
VRQNSRSFSLRRSFFFILFIRPSHALPQFPAYFVKIFRVFVFVRLLAYIPRSLTAYVINWPKLRRSPRILSLNTLSLNSIRWAPLSFFYNVLHNLPLFLHSGDPAFKDASAFEVHGKNLRKNSNPAMGALMAEAPEVLVMPVVGPSGLKKGTATMAIVATLHVTADGGAGFEEATLPLLNDVQKNEPDNLLYCLGKHPNAPTTYVFTEL